LSSDSFASLPPNVALGHPPDVSSNAIAKPIREAEREGVRAGRDAESFGSADESENQENVNEFNETDDDLTRFI
jgi:hypothetical protein